MSASPRNKLRNQITDRLPLQVVAFMAVGLFCFVIDATLLTIGVEYFHFSIILATIIGFLVANIVNYFLSISLVFINGKFKQHLEIGGFFLLVLIGLLINVAFMYLLVETFRFDYLISKIVVSIFLMIFNFFTRKHILFIK